MSQPNILLIVLDTARADFVEDDYLMPNLHELAESGTWFTSAFSNAPWTVPSHSSIFTGQYPSNHHVGVKSNVFDVELNLISELGRNKYTTMGFSNNPWISPDFGYDGFDEFTPCWQLFRRGADLAELSQKELLTEQLQTFARYLLDSNAPFTVLNAIYMKFIKDKYDSGALLTNCRIKQRISNFSNEENFFLFANYMEPHLRYDPPRQYRKEFLNEKECSHWDDINQDPWAYLTGRESMNSDDFKVLRKLYKAELHYLDHRLGNLFDYLRNTGRLENTAIIVAGDHGENIGDNGLMDHQYSVNETLLRVPLLIRYPKQFEEGKRDNRLVELRDLFATILSIADVELPDQHYQSSPSLDLSKNCSGRSAVFSEYLSPQPSIETLSSRYDIEQERIAEYDQALRAIRTKEFQLIESSQGGQELFQIDATDGNRGDISQTDHKIKKELRDSLQDALGELTMANQREKRTLDASNKQRLEDLGYL